ncbi:MAG: hypothetical protein RLZZ34_2952 [Verrucomicrobiota bacterium]
MGRRDYSPDHSVLDPQPFDSAESPTNPPCPAGFFVPAPGRARSPTGRSRDRPANGRGVSAAPRSTVRVLRSTEPGRGLPGNRVPRDFPDATGRNTRRADGIPLRCPWGSSGRTAESGRETSNQDSLERLRCEEALGIGWPTWIRTMTKGFKDPCAAITPSANNARQSKGLASRLKVNSSIRLWTRLSTVRWRVRGPWDHTRHQTRYRQATRGGLLLPHRHT